MKNVPDLPQGKADLCRLEQEGFPDMMLVMRVRAAWTLFGLLQLALRHPHLSDRVRELGMRAAKPIEAYISATPALTVIAAAGWDLELDEPLDQRGPAIAPAEAAVMRDATADLVRDLAEEVAARHVVCVPIEAGGQVHRVTLLVDPPITAGPATFTGDKTSAEGVAQALRELLAAVALEAMEKLKGARR